MQDPEENRRTTSTGKFLVAFILCAGLLKLWLVSWQQVSATGASLFDDYLFLTLGDSISQGEWLGYYDQLRMVKGPGYPMWLALIARTGVPLLSAQHVLYIFACAAFALAVRPLFPGRVAASLLFFLPLFSPWTYCALSQRVTREGIYPALTLLIFACLAGLLTSSGRSLRSWAMWSAGLGASFAFFWIIREEGIWVVPSLALVLAYAGWQVYRMQTPDKWPRLRLLSLPVIIFAATLTSVSTLNYVHYGVFGTNELKAPPFAAAYGALMRVEAETPIPRVPVSGAARRQLYEVSPAFKELQPYLEGDYSRASRVQGPEGQVDERQGEYTGASFIWAFREAVARVGHHTTAGDASVYYQALAREINEACQAGTIDCGPERASLAPPWRMSYADDMAATLWRSVKHLAVLTRIETRLRYSAGSPGVLEDYARLTHSPVARVGDNHEEFPAESSDARFKIGVLRAMTVAYRWLTPIAVVAAIAAFGIALSRDVRAKELSPLTVLNAALFGAILVRLLLLSYISVTSFEAIRPLYLAPVYSLLFACIVSTIAQLTASRARD